MNDVLIINDVPDKNGKVINYELLNDILNNINLRIEDVYLTNVVKNRPPGNRHPNRREIKEDSYWLNNQIKSVNPKLIILFGRIALKRFFPNLELVDVHGKRIERHIPRVGSFTFLPTYTLNLDNFETIKNDLKDLWSE